MTDGLARITALAELDTFLRSQASPPIGGSMSERARLACYAIDSDEEPASAAGPGGQARPGKLQQLRALRLRLLGDPSSPGGGLIGALEEEQPTQEPQ
jgi:hypothetical protein